ncbi:PLD nuclease N-terminal domain-containing protein [Arthrobacter sp. H14-L1]|uniref:PLD nuclease N-terminal domain-containing protein n=1 Tax=Arthrobacter sp. H14-L1 TaxID=2996697 RepID=UPI00226F9F99|nr:PLD nuclease N-terminal domain-containing protein [Arthrobacter sp. H14-L1]MCY0903986.1 PLD nuclease N-terminal domain-containing protein [Arthrobacter sp. H14-L1]
MIRLLMVILPLAFLIYGLIDALRSDAADVRSLPKTAWVLIIVLLPLIGVVLWLIFGRPSYAPQSNAYPKLPVAPDDDPDFLRNLETARRHRTEDERLRKLQADLAAREAKLRDDKPDDDGARDGTNRQDKPGSAT